MVRLKRKSGDMIRTHPRNQLYKEAEQNAVLLEVLLSNGANSTLMRE